MRTHRRVTLAVGLAAIIATAALATPARAAAPSSQPVAASQAARGIDGGPVAIPPLGGKAFRLSPYLPTLSVAGWTVTPQILALAHRAGFKDRAMIPIPLD